MNLTINIPDDLLAALKTRAAVEDRSVSRHVVSLIRKDLAVVAGPVSNRKLSLKDQAHADYQSKPLMERPFIKHLTQHRGYSPSFLSPMTKDQVYAIYLAESWAGPNGTRDGERLQDYDERQTDLAVYNNATGQTLAAPKPQPPIADEDDGVDWTDIED